MTGWFPPNPDLNHLTGCAPGSAKKARDTNSMKLLKCIIQPHKLEQVKDALNNLGIKGMTVSEVKGYGRQRGHKEIYRGLEYNIFFLPKIMIEVAIDDELVDEAVKVVVDNARTGHIGDGKIFVSDLANAIRIRTGEEGTDAL